MRVVLLAAGESSRTSGMKQLYEVDGEYLINKQIDKVLSYGYECAVVLGCEFEKIKGVIRKDVKIIHNKNYKDGMFSSVKSAFLNLDDKVLLFCHIDRPMPKKVVFETLLNSPSLVATASHGGKKAPPIKIDASMRDELLSSDMMRLDHWVESRKECVHLEVDDESIHFNANTDENLRRYFG